MPAERAVRLGALARLVGEREVRTGLVATALPVTGHFAAYTYVRPVLERISGVEGGLIGVLPLAYGVAGVIGNFAGGAGAARSPHRTLPIIWAALAATVLLAPLRQRPLCSSGCSTRRSRSGALAGGRTAEVLGIAPVMWVAGAPAAAALLIVLPRSGTTARRR